MDSPFFILLMPDKTFYMWGTEQPFILRIKKLFFCGKKAFFL